MQMMKCGLWMDLCYDYVLWTFNGKLYKYLAC